ncbi:MAG: VWA domain-containing protein [Sedimentisphaerales bacterium]|nr:VWA domain-containing protein [Sedimentisphaerales bacterium]
MTSHKVTLWAWGISLVAHALVIGIVILLSSRNEPGLEQPAQATQIRLEQPLPTEPPPTVIENLMVENPLILPLIPPAPPVLNPIAVADTPLSTSASEGFTIAAAPVTGELTTGTTAAVFCGTSSQGRYLCYIVDCSGSMVMALDYVQSELCRSLEALTPSQFFRLILFAGGTPSIWPAEGYRRANAPARCQAVTFVKTLQLKETPGVQAASDAVVQAIDAALTITASNDTPDTIFLLTDGEFEHQAVAQQLFRLQAQRSTPATLHVIACGNPDNEQFLRRLAQSYQGSYRFISDDELARAGRHLSQGESR